MLLLVLLLLVVAACLAVRSWPAVSEFRRVRRMIAELPGPPRLPIIGNALEVLSSPDEIYNRVHTMVSTYASYGPVCRFTLGHINILFVLQPADVEAVLTSPKALDKPQPYRALEPILGNGLVTLGGKVWRRHRKAISPSLHLDILRDFVPTFYKRGVVLADLLAGYADKGEVLDVTPLCGACTNNTVCETIMSSDLDEDDPQKMEFISATHKGFENWFYRVRRPWFLSEWIYSLHRTRYLEYVKLRKIFDEFVQKIVGEKKKAFNNNGNPLNPPRKRQAFLDHVLSSEESAALNEEELNDEVKTIVYAASDTSMQALSFFIYTLAIRQDIQHKVRQEINDVLGDDRGRSLQHSDLSNMQYTERVIKEVLRFFPSVPMFGRHITEDLTLPSGFTIPRGCVAGFWLPYMHRDPQSFPEPEKFDPDRFLPENIRGRHPFAYLPFSAGPRNCIGQRYAMMFLKTVVAALVPRLHFELPDDGHKRFEDIPITFNLTISISGGAKIRVRRCTTENQ
ncbi:Cytochrome P450 CYP4 [Frankliniella occidentalis]|uniref:Cytochrome P450 4c3-like n=1 Tax=Frankliniella occidentalis TaxID=133901 RepID=A0A6J1T6V5_FRAOC|nr:cytochrome P450 4c3-like [Frankliniella occidentalis]KAE8747695.1 Cytochrome P450 CYP4 [Frankliniella occidentalis]